MARVCMFTGKKTDARWRKRSHSMRQTKRKGWFKVNLLTKKIDLWGGIIIPIKISAKAYKKYRGLI